MLRLFATLAFVMAFMPTLTIAETDQPKVLAVLFYADWCGSCTVLDPEIQKARDKFDLDNEPVLFIRLDTTDAARRYQAGLMASSLGLGDFYEQNAGATGFMILVDAETNEIISRLTKSMDATAITSEVKAALDKATS